ncbi:ESX secretion-associated protein EspG [Skermania sp. ID1734]|uniref:ESX secretion-associated protein EspG n=1 Tax=Skermania sp. ID1734 TaxID=2597516 RepID=UPI00117D4EF5|nr:ESX secretion-associated protein EspG [Skermania sp. ID1734]TSE00785.1 ESX secretion-associated protein EspG [Skermania sp. ID1734]
MIDLGTAPSVLPAITLTADEFDLLVDRLGLTELPVVLAAVPGHAGLRTDASLARGDEIHPGLVRRLQTLSRPHWVIAMRVFSGTVTKRLCVAHDDRGSVVAMRNQNGYLLDDIVGDVSAPVLGALDPCPALRLETVNVPTADLVPVFDGAAKRDGTRERLRRLGIPSEPAATISEALARCHAHCQIVGVRYAPGIRERSERNIAVFDTAAGRFVATASHAHDGRKWTTLSSGTDARIRQAIGDLVAELATADAQQAV